MGAERPVAASASWLVAERDMQQGELYGVAGGVAGVYSARCPGREEPNEDAAALLALDDGCGVLAVADGVGGHPSGGRAARAAVEAVVTVVRVAWERWRPEPDEGPACFRLRSVTLDGFEAANAAVRDLGLGAATTLLVALLQDGKVRTCHAGDSMALLVGQRGRLKHRTTSHSPVGYGVEAGLLDEDEALHHADRHLVSNALGNPEMHIEVGPTVKLAPRDTLLLASDGLFDNLILEDIVERVRKGPLDAVVTALASESRRRMTAPVGEHPSKPDDLTFVVWRPCARP